jgi:hypothetical protein
VLPLPMRPPSPSLSLWILVAAALIAAEKLVEYFAGGEHRAARP